MTINTYLTALETAADIQEGIDKIESALIENIDLVRSNDRKYSLKIEHLTNLYLESLYELIESYDHGIDAVVQASKKMESCSKRLNDEMSLHNPFKVNNS